MGDIPSCCQQTVLSSRDSFLSQIRPQDKLYKKQKLTLPKSNDFKQMSLKTRTLIDEALATPYARGCKRERNYLKLEAYYLAKDHFESTIQKSIRNIEGTTAKSDFNGISIKGQKKDEAVLQCLNGYYTLYFAGEQYFQGIIEHNKAVVGVFVFNDHSYYVGDIYNFKANGLGYFVDSLYSYKGHWECNCIHGAGEEHFANGDTFEGNFVFGAKFGNGTYTFADGKVYEGHFYDGVPDGHGSMSWPNGNFYVGEWQEGKIRGKGKYKWKNRDIYEGEFLDGLRHGVGIYYFNRNIVYEGGWRNGVQHGKGVLKQARDQVVGVWQQGVKIDNQAKINDVIQ